MDGDEWLDLAVSGWANWETGVFRNVAGAVTPDFVWTRGHPERTDKGIGWARVDGDAWQPARGAITLCLEGGTPLALDRIELYETTGRRVGEVRPTKVALRRSRTVSLSSGDLAPGTYFAVAIGHFGDGRPYRVSRRIVVLGR